MAQPPDLEARDAAAAGQQQIVSLLNTGQRGRQGGPAGRAGGERPRPRAGRSPGQSSSVMPPPVTPGRPGGRVGGGLTGPGGGKAMSMAKPPPGRARAVMVAPWALAMALTMERDLEQRALAGQRGAQLVRGVGGEPPGGAIARRAQRVGVMSNGRLAIRQDSPSGPPA